MKNMLVIKNKQFAAFMPIDQMKEAKALRANSSLLRYARIIECIQMKPSLIKYGEVFTWNYTKNG